MAEFLIKKGDTLPRLRMSLTVGGAPLDLSGCSVNFKMRDRSGVLVVSEYGAIVGDPTDGVVEYIWGSGTGQDTSVVGLFEGEWEVFTPFGVLTAPSSGFVRIVVTERIA